ncbi:DUF3857 domain-containing protein [Pedobacter antarcticus]|uniref:DUF3857 domain-containing protein n=1 Tax=Pedobacter antarcticus TaxID=34086 RepID=UPI001C59377F|nr:DUF3857 domain-containing protein [Pedobacter antarcticus]
MLKKLYLLLFILAVIQAAQAQNPPASTLAKYGVVTLQEFKTVISGPDSAAAAVKLFDVGTGNFEVSSATGNFVYVFERHVRYQIINKSGYDLADQEITLYRNNGLQEKLEVLTANTYNLVNGKIETSTLNKEAKFTQAYDKNHTINKFTLPNVKEGSIIEFKYRTSSEFLFTLDGWYFQGSYPCLYSSFTISVPEFYSYKMLYTGYVPIETDIAKTTTRSYYMPSTFKSKAENFNANMRKVKYYAENIPAIKTENYITTLNDYVSKISFELSSTQFPGSGYKEYTTTWPKIVKELIDHEKFGGYLRRKNYPKDAIEMPEDSMEPELKMLTIFNQVKKKLKWDGKYSNYTTDASPKSVIENKSGNSAEINLLLLSLLKTAGFDACPVLISTRKNGAHPGTPMTTPFNGVIVSVHLNEKDILLDATDKNNSPDIISYQYLSHLGLKLDMDVVDASWVNIEPTQVSRASMFYNLKLDKNQLLTGDLYLLNTGYEALERRQKYQQTASESDYIKNFKATKPGMEISDYQISNLDNSDLPVDERMKITLEDSMDEAGNLVYFKPVLQSNFEENPFRLEDRKFPVDFAYPSELYYKLVMEFPEEYKLETLPKNEAFKLPEDAGMFTMIFINEGNKIMVNSKLIISKTLFSAEEYYDLRELFKNVLRKQTEQIVFRK